MNLAATLLGIASLLTLDPAASAGRSEASEASAPGFETTEVLVGATGEEKDLPLLVVLHYSGGTPAEAIADYGDLRGPVRIVAVRGTHRKRGGYSYFPADYYSLPADRQHDIARRTVAEIAVLLGSLAEAHGVKPVVTGISQGGDIAFLAAVYHPDLVLAAFPFAATIPPGIVAHAIRPGGPPVYMYQGEADPIVDVATTRRRLAELEGRIQVRLETFPGLGHDISPAMKASYSKRLDRVLGSRRLEGRGPSPASTERGLARSSPRASLGLVVEKR